MGRPGSPGSSGSPGSPGLHVHRFGDGPRLALAAHGITGNGVSWATVARALPDDWTLVAPDLRGRGGSRHLSASTGLRDHAADLVGLAETLVAEQGGPIPLVGHSMGAFVAVHTAHARPDLFSRVVLVDGGVALPVPEGVDPDAVLDATLGPAIARLSRTLPNVDSYVDLFRAHPALAPHWTDDVETYARYDALETDDGVRSAVQEASVRADGRDLLLTGAQFDPEVREIPLPVRILAAPAGMFGDPPGLLPEAGLSSYDGGAGVEHVTVEVVPDTNHYTIVFGPTAAARVAAAVTA